MPTLIHDHKVVANDPLDITVMDDPGSGGAHHNYRISWPAESVSGQNRITILFQNGPIKEHGVNGITQEVLLAIVIHRLRCFQAGPFACEANAIALSHSEAALEALKSRTRERLARGVEGTSTK